MKEETKKAIKTIVVEGMIKPLPGLMLKSALWYEACFVGALVLVGGIGLISSRNKKK